MLRIVLISMVIFFGTSVSGRAEELSAFVEKALSQNLRVQAAQSDAAAFKHQMSQSSALPDPMVKYYFMGDMLETPLGPQEDMVEIEQEIPYPSKLKQKRRMARAEYQAAEARLESLRREVVWRVQSAVYDVWSIREQKEFLQQRKNLLDQLSQSLTSAYASGISMQKETIMARENVAMTDERLIMLNQQEQTLTADLQNLLNSEEAVTLPDDGFGHIPDVPPLDVLLSKIPENPDIQESESMIRKEQSAVSEMRLENRPDFKVGFQYIGIGDENMGMDPDEGRDAWMIPVTVTVPFWQHRIRSGVKEAQQRLESSQANGRQAYRDMELELKKTYYEYEAQKKIVGLYQNELIPQAEIRELSDRSAYESGQQDMSAWVESRIRLLDLRMTLSQTRAEVFKSRAMLEKIAGHF